MKASKWKGNHKYNNPKQAAGYCILRFAGFVLLWLYYKRFHKPGDSQDKYDSDTRERQKPLGVRRGSGERDERGCCAPEVAQEV